MSRTLIICFCALIAFASEARAQENVTVFLDSTAQVIRGFGGAYIHGWRPDMTEEEIETAFGTEEGQLGFNILRLKIDPNPANWEDNLFEAQKASEMGALVFASPWNAPDDMLKPGLDGDTVAVDKYGEYAAHLDSFNTYMAENGVDLYAISVQNEPDYAEDWTGWSPEGMVTFLRDYAPSIDTRIIAPESFQFRREMSDPILNDSLAAAHTDIIGGHIYGAGIGTYDLALEKGKEVWMTEHYVDSQNSGNVWTYAMQTGEEIQGVMKSNMNAYIWWYLVRFYGPIADGEVPFVDASQYFGAKGDVTKKGYVMSQFSRFVRPGYMRVHTSRHGIFSRLSVTAYKDDARVVIVATNGGVTSKDVTLSLEGGIAGRFSRYVTSETQNVERLDDVEAAENGFTVTLAPGTVTTFVSEYSGVSSEEIASDVRSYELLQNFPNPFRETTTISYEVPRPGDVTLEVFDLLGRKVATLVDGRVSAGSHRVTFEPGPLSGGVYLYRLKAGDAVRTGRMALVR